MLSMAGASLFFQFLPMTPTQVLLGTTLYDVSQLSIPGDNVDSEETERPRPFDISLIYQAMLRYGLVSSVFDYLTFGFLWFILKSSEVQFQTGWFVMSAITQTFVVITIRTWRTPFWKSRPRVALVVSLLFAVVTQMLLPYTVLGYRLGMAPLPAQYWYGVAFLVPLYLVAVESMKFFWRKQLLSLQGPRRNRLTSVQKQAF